MIGLYAVVLVISFSYRLLFYLYGYRYYEKVWALIHKKFPKVSDRFNSSFYILFLYSWIAVFFIAAIFHMAGNRLGEYLFIGTFMFFASPVMMFLNVWSNDTGRAAVTAEEFPDGATIIRRRKFRKKVFLYTLCLALVCGVAGFSCFYYIKIYGPHECDKLAAANDARLAESFKAGNKSLGQTISVFANNRCYGNIWYSYPDNGNHSLTNVFMYLEDLRSGKTISSCRSQDDGGRTLPPGCLQYHKDYYKLFYQTDFDESAYLAPLGK